MTQAARFLFAAVVIFAASGFAGLIYESIWAQYLKLFLGHAAYAQTMVLCLFMGGLALGAAVAARYAEKIRNPLLVYAAVELAIGLLGLFFHGIFTWAMEFHYANLLPLSSDPLIINIIKCVLALLLIGPQTILLGATFPLMTSAVLRTLPAASGDNIALLYFSNSIGAAAGVLASAFLLISWSGLPGTLFTAALINIGVALFAWLLLRSTPAAQAPEQGRYTSPSRGSPRASVLLLATALFTGLASFVYEVTWVRMLSLVLGASTHSFELMLSAFITGLALGSLAIRRWISRIDAPYRFLGYVQVLMGVFALGSLWVYGQSFEWMGALMKGIARTDQGYTVYLIASHLLCFVVMLPTTFMAGMTLPLLTHGLLREGYGERSIGAVYAWNTLGSIGGVLLAIHFLIPELGLKAALIVGAGVDMLTGIVLLCVAASTLFEPIMATAAALLFVSVATWGIVLDPRKLSSGVYRDARVQVLSDTEVISHRDGKTATISLLRQGDQRSLLTNGKPDASIKPFTGPPATDEVTGVLLAGLGMLHHPHARSAANIGLGSGVTTRMLLKNPRLQSVDTIEIEAQMVSTVRQLSDQVGEIFSDPRSRIIIDDAKSYFAANRSRYDLIIAEPSNPWVSGVASLFTAEFYRSMLRHMADDGVFVQWMQTYETDYPSISSVMHALGSAFPNYTVYSPIDGDILIVAWKNTRPREPDTALLALPGLKAEFNRVGVENMPDLEALRIGGRAVLAPLMSSIPAPENSDYYPFLDSRAARARVATTQGAALDITRLGTLPLVALLERREPPYAQTRMSQYAYTTKGASMHNAQALFQVLMHLKSETQPGTNNRIHLTILNAFCNGSTAAHRDDALSAFIDLIEATVPYLTAAESRQILTRLKQGNCLSRLGSSVETYVGLLAHALDGNGKDMRQTGERLLRLNAGNADRVSVLALDAAMVGAIMEGKPGIATALWQTHGSKTALLRPVPLGIQLTLALAMPQRQ